jgi:serine/threonine protein kinase
MWRSKSSNAQFSERFTQEARAIAALNHTNICHLYDVGPDCLVMEFVEGSTFVARCFSKRRKFRLRLLKDRDAGVCVFPER